MISSFNLLAPQLTTFVACCWLVGWLMNDAPRQHRCTHETRRWLLSVALAVDLISYYNFLSPWFGLELCRFVGDQMVLVVHFEITRERREAGGVSD